MQNVASFAEVRTVNPPVQNSYSYAPHTTKEWRFFDAQLHKMENHGHKNVLFPFPFTDKNENWIFSYVNDYATNWLAGGLQVKGSANCFRLKKLLCNYRSQNYSNVPIRL